MIAEIKKGIKTHPYITGFMVATMVLSLVSIPLAALYLAPLTGIAPMLVKLAADAGIELALPLAQMAVAVSFAAVASVLSIKLSALGAGLSYLIMHYLQGKPEAHNEANPMAPLLERTGAAPSVTTSYPGNAERDHKSHEASLIQRARLSTASGEEPAIDASLALAARP